MLQQIDRLPACWRMALGAEFQQPYYVKLMQFLQHERDQNQVFPAEADVFNALMLTPLENVRVVILGQDPYHDDGQAHGLSFSVQQGVRLPPSLRNIFRELHSDLGIEPSPHGCLQAWAEQGVLLLNTVLTVRAHAAGSHRGHGWEQFTTRVIHCVNEQRTAAFVLWGNHAQQKADLISDRHLVIRSPHPSPLSARRGFFGSRPFSQVNEFLERTGQRPIGWDLRR